MIGKVGRHVLTGSFAKGEERILAFSLLVMDATSNGCVKHCSASRLSDLLSARGSKVSRQTCSKYMKLAISHGYAHMDGHTLVLCSLQGWVKQRIGRDGEPKRCYSPYEQVRLIKPVEGYYKNITVAVQHLRMYVIATLQSNGERLRQQANSETWFKTHKCRQSRENKRYLAELRGRHGANLGTEDWGMSVAYLTKKVHASAPTLRKTNELALENGVYSVEQNRINVDTNRRISPEEARFFSCDMKNGSTFFWYSAADDCYYLAQRLPNRYMLSKETSTSVLRNPRLPLGLPRNYQKIS